MKKLTKFVAIEAVLIILLPVFSTFAQSSNDNCPSVRMNQPGGVVEVEGKAILTLEVAGGSAEHNTLSFDWFVSSGHITSGQGKQTVEILTDEEDAGTVIKVAALVRGLPSECSASASAEFNVASLPIGEPVDQFNKIGPSRTAFFSLLSRLDSYLAELTNNRGYEGFITIEFNKDDSLQHKLKHLQRMYRHFALRKFDLTRITFAISEQDGPESTTLWTMSPNAKMPKYARNYRIIKAEDYRNRLNCLFPLD